MVSGSLDGDSSVHDKEREGVGGESSGEEGRGTWKHAAFHVATTIATPAAYAPLPFAVSSLGWPLGNYSNTPS